MRLVIDVIFALLPLLLILVPMTALIVLHVVLSKKNKGPKH